MKNRSVFRLLSGMASKALSANVTSVVKKLCEFTRPTLGSSYTDANAVNQYRGWVYAASTHNATNVADAEVKLFTNIAPKVSKSRPVTRKDLTHLRTAYQMKALNTAQEVEAHPILELMARPNEEDTLYSFMFKIDIFLELVGDAYILVEKNALGIPSAMYVLFSQYVTIQTDGQNQVTSYNYGIARDGKFEFSYTPEQIIHIKFFDPGDVHYGISPLEASARAQGLIDSSTTFEEALNRNMGVPAGVLHYKNQRVKEEERSEFEAKWTQKFAGVGRAGKVIVTDQDITYDPKGIAPRDMQFLNGRKWSREEIVACYGVNPAMLLNSDVNRSNMITASINYYHNTLKPRLKLISQTLTRGLIQRHGIDGENLFIVLWKDAPQDQDHILKKAKLLADNNAIDINELRVMMGQERRLEEEANRLTGVEA